MTRAVRSSQQGFALVAALFLMVVVAVLGTYAVRIGSSQQGGTNLELGSAGAEAALQSGIQYAAARLTTNSNTGCTRLTSPITLAQNFRVAFICNTTETLANTPTLKVFSVTVTASRGVYGSPDFVSRQRDVRIITP